MKRNYDLIRDILVAVEQRADGDHVIALKTQDFTDRFPAIIPVELNEHIQMLAEHGFIDAEPHQLGWFILRLTWSGHDFIEQSREATVWAKVKHFAGHLNLDAFASVLKENAVAYAKSCAGL